jgi:hypothetical protein
VVDLSSGPDVFGPNPYVAKREVVGTVVAVLRGVSERRGLAIHGYRSRALPAGQIHELMTTDEPAPPHTAVERVALLAFFEVEQGGIVLVGDDVEVDGSVIGAVAGFNDTHMPNHQNICLRSAQLVDGESSGLRLGARVRFLKTD